MINYTMHSPQFLMRNLKNITRGVEDIEEYVSKISSRSSSISNNDERVNYIIRQCGKYLTSVGLAIIENMEEIKECKIAIQN